MSEVENLRMKNFGQDFQRLDYARSRTIEVLIAVGEKHLVVLDRTQRVPVRIAAQRG